MDFQILWMVKRRFSRCLLLPWLKIWGRRSILFCVLVCVRCGQVGFVLVEEAVFGGFEHRCRVFGEGAVCLLDSGDGAVAGVGHGVVEVAFGFSGELVGTYRLLSWAMRCWLWMWHCCRSALMWAICLPQFCMWWRAWGVSAWR